MMRFNIGRCRSPRLPVVETFSNAFRHAIKSLPASNVVGGAAE
jgi:hypothetical protein